MNAREGSKCVVELDEGDHFTRTMFTTQYKTDNLMVFFTLRVGIPIAHPWIYTKHPF